MAKISLAFYQPDIPQNVGAAMRLSACLDVPMHIIEPCGFAWKENEFKRSGMDYRNHVDLTKFSSWDTYKKTKPAGRLILLTTKASVPYTDITYQDGDTLLLGRESAGVPDDVHAHVMVLGEAIRQVNA